MASTPWERAERAARKWCADQDGSTQLEDVPYPVFARALLRFAAAEGRVDADGFAPGARLAYRDESTWSPAEVKEWIRAEAVERERAAEEGE